MHFYTLNSDLKRDAFQLKDDLLKFYLTTINMSSKLRKYVPFTGDNHAREHFELSYRVTLLRSRIFDLNKELDNMINLLNKNG